MPHSQLDPVTNSRLASVPQQATTTGMGKGLDIFNIASRDCYNTKKARFGPENLNHTFSTSTSFGPSDQIELGKHDEIQSYPSDAGSQSQTFHTMDRLPSSNTQDQPGTKRERDLLNFSHFTRPAVLVKARFLNSRTPGLSKTEKLKSSNAVESGLGQSATGSESVMGFQNQPVPVAAKIKLNLLNAKPQKETFQDEQPGAVCQDEKRKGSTHRKRTTETSIQPLFASSSSVCSPGASNNPTCYVKRKYQKIDEASHFTQNTEEDSKGVARPVHNLSERIRRDKINKKMLALRDLIPNCNKVDKASVLNDAIEYIKVLQFQVQIMSMGCMPQMSLSTGMQQIRAPSVPEFSPLGVGMGMKMGMDFGCNPLQFPTFMSGATSLLGAGNSGIRFPMLGLPGQVLPMSFSHAPFINFPGGPFAQSAVFGNVSGTASMAELPTSAFTSVAQSEMLKRG